MKVLNCLIFLLFISRSLLASSISEVPLEILKKKSSEKEWFFEIEGPDAKELKSRLEMRGIKSKLGKNTLAFSLSSYPSMLIKTPPYTLNSSFLINFHKEEFKSLKVVPTTPLEIRDFVFTHITDKNYSKGIELAHQTLKSKSGDCTEHAILLTALLRQQKIPARVILGIVVIEELKQAYMHAWTEFQDINNDGHFKFLDATKSAASGHQYIPLFAVENESASFAKDFLKALNLRFEKVRLL